MKMVITLKKTCNGCRAFSDNGSGGKCDLGYKVGDKKVIYNCITIEYKPLEECPKPKTYDEYHKLIIDMKHR